MAGKSVSLRLFWSTRWDLGKLEFLHRETMCQKKKNTEKEFPLSCHGLSTIGDM